MARAVIRVLPGTAASPVSARGYSQRVPITNRSRVWADDGQSGTMSTASRDLDNHGYV